KRRVSLGQLLRAGAEKKLRSTRAQDRADRARGSAQLPDIIAGANSADHRSADRLRLDPITVLDQDMQWSIGQTEHEMHRARRQHVLAHWLVIRLGERGSDGPHDRDKGS